MERSMRADDGEARERRTGESALLVVDVQRDFLPGGALPVRDGDRVIAPLNRCLARFAHERRPVFLTRDWHPVDHCSFVARGGPWPVHCVAGTAGAAFADGLQLPPDAVVVSKGCLAEVDAYSGFGGTDLAQRLRPRGIRRLVVGGVATDYCVLQTVLDARRLEIEVRVMTDAIAAVDVNPGDGQDALQRMSQAGAALVTSDEVLSSPL
ncbi:MAG TPA: isochorismatase family protein [Albitalea sp.]|nr:isochorismatase family protein [Albitalea sp.]